MKIRILIILMIFSSVVYAQNNRIQATAWFLDLNTNSRIGGVGGIGVVSSSFYNDAGLSQNPALLSRNGTYSGVNGSYVSWLSALTDSPNLKSFGGFYSINSKNTIGCSIKSLEFGDVRYISDHTSVKFDKLYDYSIQFTYSYHLYDNLSLGAGAKYIKASVDNYLLTNSTPSMTKNTFSLDIGAEYDESYTLSEKSRLNIHLGGAINNFGPRVDYPSTPNLDKTFLPTRLSLGFLVNHEFDLSKDTRFNIDFAYQLDKFLVPTPPMYDVINGDVVIVDGKDPNISPFRALYQSFYDAPGGLTEEIHELRHKVGTEFRINNKNIFYAALRFGRFMEHETKGQKYNTLGLGLGFYGLVIDYNIIKVGGYSALDNTWAITLGYHATLNEAFRFKSK